MQEIRLSETQRQIVETEDGAVLVLASAGSGKTRVLTERVRYLITEKPGKFKVLALTFTNKAAEEMKSRLKIIEGIQDRTFIGTIHKFCLELIRSKGATIGINTMPHIFERETDRLAVLIDVFNNNPTFKKYLESLEEKKQRIYLNNVLNFISQKKKNLFGLALINLNEDDETNILYNEYNSVLNSQNAIDFDDVICLAYKIFIDRPKVADLYRKMYKYVCIDEAQDLNYAQYELIKVLCGQENSNVLMVGDPNQAIYGFNGSDKTYMTNQFLKDFSARKIILSENYRSSKKVLTAANKLIPNSVDLSNTVIEGELEIIDCKDELSEADWIVNKISFFLKEKAHPDIEGKITTENIAILARNKYVFLTIENQLKKNNIPFFIKRTNDFSEYESDIIKIFDLGIRILVNPLDKLHYLQLCNILNIDLVNVGGYKGIEKLEVLLDQISENDLKEDFKKIIQAWKLIDSNVNAFLKALDLLETYVEISNDYSQNSDKKTLAIQDIEELREIWKQYSLNTHTENKTLANFRNQIALGISTGKSNKNNGLTLSTIHSVKGLEFDIVFLMGMNEGTFPDYRSIKNGTSALIEEKNNTFVAITRSRRLLYITYPRQKFMPWDKVTPVRQRPSRYLSAIS